MSDEIVFPAIDVFLLRLPAPLYLAHVTTPLLELLVRLHVSLQVFGGGESLGAANVMALEGPRVASLMFPAREVSNKDLSSSFAPLAGVTKGPFTPSQMVAGSVYCTDMRGIRMNTVGQRAQSPALEPIPFLIRLPSLPALAASLASPAWTGGGLDRDSVLPKKWRGCLVDTP